MNEPKFQAAVLAALADDYCNELSAADSGHVFSAGFEKKMDKLIRRRRKPYYMLISTAMRRAACLIVIFGAGLVLAARGAVYAAEKYSDDFLIAESEGRITVIPLKDLDAPRSIEIRYEITELPEGFALDHYNVTEREVYMNYNDGYDEIFFKQTVKTDFWLSVTEYADEFERVQINGHKALLRETESFTELYWDNGEYIISLTAPFGKDELIRLAGSVQKAENQQLP